MQAAEAVRREARAAVAARVAARRPALVAATQRLVAAASPNPPGDVSLAADAAHALLAEIPGLAVERFETAPGIVNLVGRLTSERPGRRLVFNGHLDTFPLGENLGWTVDPLGGELRDGRLYGRGVSDMKAGVAASIEAVAALAARPDAWSGEIVVTLAGDEETMGSLGTKWLLDNVPHARGDAMICGDAGSPLVARFGEKGLLWVEIDAVGAPAHGAHVHKGVNAIDRLRAALDRLKALEALEPAIPPEVEAAVAAAEAVSEPLSGVGEGRVLRAVTVNIGTIEGGVSPNLVPSHARAKADVRVPVGLTTAAVRARLAADLDDLEGVSWRVLQAYEPLHTPPGHEIVRLTLAAAEEVLGRRPVANMRVGASDARLYRLAGVPSVVFGPTPHNMGAADEHVVVDEVAQVALVHALAAFDFLQA